MEDTQTLAEILERYWKQKTEDMSSLEYVTEYLPAHYSKLELESLVITVVEPE